MDNVDLSILRRVSEWKRGGYNVVLGTVTRTWGSAPRPVGSVVAIREDGQIVGSVSGGCIEDDLIDRMKNGLLNLQRPEIAQYGVGAEEAKRFGLPCGGTLEIFLEPVTKLSRIDELLLVLNEGSRVRRTVYFVDGHAVHESVGREVSDMVQLYNDRIVSTHGPNWRLLLIGAGQMTSYLASMAIAIGYEVLICDPREEYANTWEVPGTHLLRTMPDDTVIAIKPDAHTAIIALTHDPKLDDLALMEALKSEAFYVGAIGSRVNQQKRKERLREFNVTEDELARLYGPVGLKNGARTPPEIAVSILAQLTAVRYGYVIPEPIPVILSNLTEAGSTSTYSE